MEKNFLKAGEMENKAISASNLKLKLKLTEAELGNQGSNKHHYCFANISATKAWIFMKFDT